MVNTGSVMVDSVYRADSVAACGGAAGSVGPGARRRAPGTGGPPRRGEAPRSQACCKTGAGSGPSRLYTRGRR